MKNIYAVKNYVRFDDEWEEIFVWDYNYKYLTPEEAKVFENTFCVVCRTFEKLREQVDRFPGIKENYTFFRSRPYIRVRGSDWQDDGKYYDEKHFKKPISFKKVCEVARYLTINDLMKELSAKDFVEWWKDHTGETQCPFKKNS